VSVIKVLPELRANGAAQMALDQGLLEAADEVVARRYTWAPPALSLGRFQKWDHEVPRLPFDVVRRPSGGRAVLHGEDFEWSFAFAFPPGSLGEGVRAAADVAAPYDLVAGSFAAALEALGVQLDAERLEPYHRSTLCFATALRHDLSARGEKLVAVAQARAGGRVLVHGSVLERRPPEELTQVAETLLGEPWQGEGLSGAGYVLAADMVWKRVLVRLEAALRGLAP
jgi:lipoate-protein ligase A